MGQHKSAEIDPYNVNMEIYHDRSISNKQKKVAQMSRQTWVKNKNLDPVFHEGSQLLTVKFTQTKTSLRLKEFSKKYAELTTHYSEYVKKKDSRLNFQE